MLLISITDDLDQYHIDKISTLVHPLKVCVEKNLSLPNAPLEDVEILITYGDQVNKETLDQMKSLKWIQVFQSGIESLPMEEISKRNILLTNIRDIHGIPMAEYVLSMVLYFTRDLAKYAGYQKEKRWCHEEYVDEAFTKTISIFGAGSIGQCIAERCKQFGMRVIGVNTNGNPKPYFDAMFSMKDKLIVLNQSDFVVLLLPATAETYHSFGKMEFKAMKKDAYLINIGRGSLVNTQELITSLNEEDIRGAALDVVEVEPLPSDHPIWDAKNVIITPHIAVRTRRYLDRAIERFALNLQAYKSGERPLYYVDLQKGY